MTQILSLSCGILPQGNQRQVLPTAGTSGPVVQDPTATGVGASASSASAKRAGGEQEERSHKRLGMLPTKGQKRPADSGGETSKAKDFSSGV